MAEVSYRQSLAPFAVLLGLPAGVLVLHLVRLGAWGLLVFAPSDPLFRNLYGYGPLALAACITLATAGLVALQGRVVYRVTPTRLYVHRGRRAPEVWPLDRLYLSRHDGWPFGSALLSDGRRTLKVQRLFLPRFDRFCRLLQVLTRIRRQVQSL